MFSTPRAGVYVKLQKSPREALMFLQSYKSLCARRWTFCSLTEVLRRRFLRHELLRQPSSDGLVVAFQTQISQQNTADINNQGRGPYLAEGIKFVGCPVRCSEKQMLKSPIKLQN